MFTYNCGNYHQVSEPTPIQKCDFIQFSCDQINAPKYRYTYNCPPRRDTPLASPLKPQNLMSVCFYKGRQMTSMDQRRTKGQKYIFDCDRIASPMRAVESFSTSTGNTTTAAPLFVLSYANSYTFVDRSSVTSRVNRYNR